MEFQKRNPKIYVLSGKAKSGKNYVGEMIEKNSSNPISISYAYYLKDYTKRILNWDGSEETKPREFLQQLGIELIQKEISKMMLIDRVKQDIEVFSYFYDTIIITDARLKEEVEMPKKYFSNVTTIRIIRTDYEDGLTELQKKHVTETGLDTYTNFDYTIENHNDDVLKEEVLRILKEDVHEV